jgi:hypothetical protein
MSNINKIRMYYDVLLKVYRSYGHFCISVNGFFPIKTFSHISDQVQGDIGVYTRLT